MSEIELIKKLYVEDKLKVEEIARKIYMNKGSVYKILRKLDIPRRKKPVDKNIFDVETIRRLYIDEKLTTTQIAEIYNVSFWYIYNYMKVNNIPIRKRGGSRGRKKR